MRAHVLFPLAALLSCAGSPSTDPNPPPSEASAASAPAADARFDPPYTPVPDDVAEPPRFKPSSKSPEPLPITTNAYGAFSGAPDAPQLGERAEDFTVPLASGGTFDLGEARAAGPVLLMFYRGFW